MCIVAGFALALAAGTLRADPSTPAPVQGFVPGLGEIMALQQMRHAKLWLAGSAGNWALAGYELDELREGFEDAARYYPAHEGVPVAAMVNSLTPAPLAALAKAIEGRQRAQFAKAFDQMSATCNACHQAAGKGFIRIVRPVGSGYPNQDFRPAPKQPAMGGSYSPDPAERMRIRPRFGGNDRAFGEFSSVQSEKLDAKRRLIHVANVHKANDSRVRAAERNCKFAEILVQGDDNLQI